MDTFGVSFCLQILSLSYFLVAGKFIRLTEEIKQYHENNGFVFVLVLLSWNKARRITTFIIVTDSLSQSSFSALEEVASRRNNRHRSKGQLEKPVVVHCPSQRPETESSSFSAITRME